MTRVSTLRTGSYISFTTKYRLYKSLVILILMYGRETWTLNVDKERRVQAFEHKCRRRCAASPTWSKRPTITS
ncbi:hypothetical protein DPMN_164538 [Dreissena polymorpha]|uniref:Uncharacterized protein n=1 Tax=Dreissena polymorpha TaxID=45954 RepID=A0A9D4EY00_DREPO|nr:hypothetical protein DPMN_164538 [Dreissena polymorpha]